MSSFKNRTTLILMIFCAIIIGGFIGEFFNGNSLLGFLSWGFPIGTADNYGNFEPMLVNLKVLQFSLGILIHINFASITALVFGLYFYTKM